MARDGLGTEAMQVRLRVFSRQFTQRRKALVDYHAQRCVAQAKEHAPWTDRTGAARSSLFAKTTHTETSSEITLAHGVKYGIWLEVSNSGKYQIIMPTIRAEGRELMKSIEDVFGSM